MCDFGRAGQVSGKGPYLGRICSQDGPAGSSWSCPASTSTPGTTSSGPPTRSTLLQTRTRHERCPDGRYIQFGSQKGVRHLVLDRALANGPDVTGSGSFLDAREPRATGQEEYSTSRQRGQVIGHAETRRRDASTPSECMEIGLRLHGITVTHIKTTLKGHRKKKGTGDGGFSQRLC